MEAWRFKDPFHVVSRIEEQEARKAQNKQEQARKGLQALFEEAMTEEQSRKLEEYLMVWYEYERAYRPNLGAPRMSVYAKGMPATEIYADMDESEARWELSVAETISACMDELPWQQRSAITIRCEARHTGASVIRNPRMTLEEHHRQYQAGKLAIFWMPRMRELLR